MAGCQSPASTGMTGSTPTRPPGKDPTVEPGAPARRPAPEHAHEQETLIKKAGTAIKSEEIVTPV